METPPPCAVIPKNSREEVRVCLDEFGGRQLVDVRVYADFNAGPVETRGPTKKGVALAVERLPDLIKGLEAAKAEAIRRGLLTEG